MSSTFTYLSELTSDAVLFPALQVVLVSFVLFFTIMEMKARKAAGRGGTKLIIGRSETSMSRFWAVYAAANGLLVLICLTVDADIARNHRVFWVMLDTGLVLYVCLFNPWFRNLLVGWTEKLRTMEKR